MTEPNRTEHPEPHLETVFATSEADVVPVIKSVLEAAEIPYVTDGEAMMNLFPSDLLGPTFHRSRGELCFQVDASRAEEARALLTQHSDVRYPEELVDQVAESSTPSDDSTIETA